MSETTKVVASTKADANQRTWRTAVQGLLATVVLTVFPIVQGAIAGGLDKVNWTVTGYAAGTAAVITFISWAMAYAKPVIGNDVVADAVDQAVKEAEAKWLAEHPVPQVTNVVNVAAVDPVVPDLVAGLDDPV